MGSHEKIQCEKQILALDFFEDAKLSIPNFMYVMNSMYYKPSSGMSIMRRCLLKSSRNRRSARYVASKSPMLYMCPGCRWSSSACILGMLFSSSLPQLFDLPYSPYLLLHPSHLYQLFNFFVDVPNLTVSALDLAPRILDLGRVNRLQLEISSPW